MWVYGDSLQAHLIGVAHPNKAWVLQQGAQLGLGDNFEELCKKQEIRKLVLEDVTKIGKQQGLVGFEQIKAVHLEPVRKKKKIYQHALPLILIRFFLPPE